MDKITIIFGFLLTIAIVCSLLSHWLIRRFLFACLVAISASMVVFMSLLYESGGAYLSVEGLLVFGGGSAFVTSAAIAPMIGLLFLALRRKPCRTKVSRSALTSETDGDRASTL